MASELRGLSLAFRWTGAAARKVKAEKSPPPAAPPADEASPLVSRRRDDEEGSLAADSSPESAAKLARAATEAPDLTRRRSAAAKRSTAPPLPRAGRGGRRWTGGGASSESPIGGVGLACSVSLSPFPPCACRPLDSVETRRRRGGRWWRGVRPVYDVVVSARTAWFTRWAVTGGPRVRVPV